MFSSRSVLLRDSVGYAYGSQPAKASDTMMIKACLIIFSTDKGLSRERQTFDSGRMEAASPVSPIFGGRKHTAMSFSALSETKHDMDGASHRFEKAKALV